MDVLFGSFVANFVLVWTTFEHEKSIIFSYLTFKKQPWPLRVTNAKSQTQGGAQVVIKICGPSSWMICACIRVRHLVKPLSEIRGVEANTCTTILYMLVRRVWISTTRKARVILIYIKVNEPNVDTSNFVELSSLWIWACEAWAVSNCELRPKSLKTLKSELRKVLI